MKDKKADDFVPQYRHKYYTKIYVQFNEDKTLYRIKGEKDSKSTSWKKVGTNREGFKFIKLGSEKVYFEYPFLELIRIENVDSER